MVKTLIPPENWSWISKFLNRPREGRRQNYTLLEQKGIIFDNFINCWRNNQMVNSFLMKLSKILFVVCSWQIINQKINLAIFLHWVMHLNHNIPRLGWLCGSGRSSYSHPHSKLLHANCSQAIPAPALINDNRSTHLLAKWLQPNEQLSSKREKIIIKKNRRCASCKKYKSLTHWLTQLGNLSKTF